MKNDIYNEIFDDLISYTGSKYIGENYNPDEKQELVEFSREHQKRMKRLLSGRSKVFHITGTCSRLKRALACIAIFLIITIIPVFSVDALRSKLFNFIIDMKQTYTDIIFSYASDTKDSYHSDAISFEYLPSGFKLEKKEERENFIYMKFKAEDKYFTFSMYSISGSIGIDTENAQVKRVMINNREALLSSNENVKILVWNDDAFSYKLSGNIGEDTMIEIAKKIKK